MRLNKELKKIFICITAFIMVFHFLAASGLDLNWFISLSASAAENEIDYSQYGTGLIPMTDDEIENYFDSDTEDGIASYSDEILPESCDLSTSIYFPPIGDQQGVGSCTAWATTYYQFTYEAHKLNNIATTAENAYSPRWTYNLINGGVDNGSSFVLAYDVLSQYGALTMKDHPYKDSEINTVNSENFDYSWSGNTEAMVEALNTRIDGNVHSVSISASNASTSSELDKIRKLLYSGKILTFQTDFSWNYKIRKLVDDNGAVKTYINDETNSFERVAYRASDDDESCHAMTIVGYDDSVWCDINLNNAIDDGEIGAFKVANSWGTNWGNSGYTWVSYDALNRTSTVTGNWEDVFTTERIPIFNYNTYGNNNVYYIDVTNKEVNYVGQLTVDTNYRNSLGIRIARRESNITNTDSIDAVAYNNYKGNVNLEIPYTGTFVFDYDDLAEPIGDYISGYNWFVLISGNHNSLSFKITDNLSNTIVDYGEISAGYSYDTINLSMGDLDYNGVIDSNDSQILFDALYKDGSLSNLQKYLATNMSVDPPIRAAVTPAGFDDIGSVLNEINAYNIIWESVSNNIDLQTLIDGNYDVLFVNCPSNVDGDTLKKFVEQGGTVYASDWAIESLTSAFPERELTYSFMDAQIISGNVIDEGLRTSTGLDEVTIDFDLYDWCLVNSELQSDVTIYIEGNAEGLDDEAYPFIFSFPYGDNGGKVFYTSFHHSANNTEDMRNVLYDLVLKINHNKDINELEEWSETNGYDSMMSVAGVLDAEETSDFYELDSLEDGNDFAIVTNETGNFSVELTAPDGNTYTNFENGEYIYGTLSASNSNTTVYSLGKRGLSVSNPDSTSDQWSFTVTSNTKYRSSYVVGIAEKEDSADAYEYEIEYAVSADWGSGQNVQVTITNLGEEPIRNWALQCDDFCGTVSNVWNAVLHSENIIKNASYNSGIAPGESLTFGYTLTDATGEIPTFTLCTFRSVKADGYTTSIDVLSEWGSGFIGAITITNTTDTPIMAWELSFDADNFTISDTSQFVILENLDDSYKITGTYNGNIPIPANTSITLQFNGTKTGTPALSNVCLTEVVF